MIMVIVMFIAIIMYHLLTMVSIANVIVDVLVIVVVYASVIVSVGCCCDCFCSCYCCTSQSPNLSHVRPSPQRWEHLTSVQHFNRWWIFEINGLQFHLLIETPRKKEKKHIQYISHRTWLQDPPRNWCKSLDEKRLITRKSSRRSHIQQAMSQYQDWAIWVSGKWLIV